MAARVEEDPEPDEEPAEEPSATAVATPAPTVSGPVREFEYRSEPLSEDQVTDGTLVARLNEGSADGWDLVDVIAAGEKRVLLMRRPKRPSRESRPVGFIRPA